MNMKHLYYAHTEFDDYRIVVKANNEDEAENLVKEWFFDNISSFDNSDVKWIIELCDNDEPLE